MTDTRGSESIKQDTPAPPNLYFGISYSNFKNIKYKNKTTTTEKA